MSDDTKDNIEPTSAEHESEETRKDEGSVNNEGSAKNEDAATNEAKGASTSEQASSETTTPKAPAFTVDDDYEDDPYTVVEETNDSSLDSFAQEASALFRAAPAFTFDHVTITDKKTGRSPLSNVYWRFETGKLVALTGAADDQRRAFMAAAGGFIRPNQGQVMLKSASLADLEINEIRGHRLALIPQQYAVWDELDALSNVTRTMKASGRTFLNPIPQIARQLLKTVGFDEAVTGVPLIKVSELNRRRVAVARAISCDATVIIADDPLHGLEREDQKTLLALLKRLAHQKDPRRCVIVLDEMQSDDVAQTDTNSDGSSESDADTTADRSTAQNRPTSLLADNCDQTFAFDN